jgi:hypothetical protein
VRKFISIFYSVILIFFVNYSASFARQNSTAQEMQNINTNIEINKSLLTLKSEYLKKDFAAYKISITSKYPNPLNIVSGDVINAQDSFIIYLSTMESALSGYYSGTAYNYRKILKNTKEAKLELMKYNQKIPLFLLNPGTSISFDIIVPLGQTPSVYLNLYDLNTFKLYTISR